MKQEVEELLIEISSLEDELSDTQKLIEIKSEKLQEICPHEKMVKDNVYSKVILFEITSILYTCLLCKKIHICESENQELENKVVH